MTDRRQLWAYGLLLTLSAVLAALAALMMFSTFMFYDDEGYMLISVRNFIAHGNLYRDVYSQYGPFPYAFYSVLHALGFPVTQVAGRILTLIIWAGCALTPAFWILHLTKRLLPAASVMVALYVYLWIMTSEPSHPGGLIAAIVTLLAWGGTRAMEGKRHAWWAILTGAGVAALLLIKVNVGGFAGLSAFAYMVLNAKSSRARKWIVPALIMAATIFPFVLMKSLLQAAWVHEFAVLFALAAATVILAASRRTARVFGCREVIYAAVAGLTLGMGVLAYTIYRGSSVSDLLHGILFDPLRHPVHFSLRFPWPAWTWPAAVVSCLLCLFLTRIAPTEERSGLTIAIGRLGVAVYAAAVAVRFPTVSPDNLIFSALPAALWLLVWPLPSEPISLVVGRNWIALLLLGQFLHPFPVPGSQIAWGTFLIIPLIAVSTWTAIEYLRINFLGTSPLWRPAMANLALSALAVDLAYQFSAIGNRYYIGRNVDLPGAGPLRLPDISTAIYRILAFNARIHSDMLFSLPGMFTLNQWTGLPTPTAANATHWFSLLSASQQQEVVRSLRAHPSSVVIEQQEHVSFLAKHDLQPAGVIYDFIREQYTPAFVLDQFAFLVRKGREVAPFFTAERFTKEKGAPGEGTLIKLPVYFPESVTLSKIALLQADNNSASPIILSGANARIELTPIDLENRPVGGTVVSHLPQRIEGPCLLNVYFENKRNSFSPDNTLIVFLGSSGEELALALFR